MKLLNVLCLCSIGFGISAFAGADEVKPLFSMNTASLLSEGRQMEVQILSDGSFHGLVSKRGPDGQRVTTYDDTFATLTSDGWNLVNKVLPRIKPGMTLQKVSTNCASDGATVYTVSGTQYPGGSIEVAESPGCGVLIGIDPKIPGGAYAASGIHGMVSMVQDVIQEYGAAMNASSN